MFLFLILVYYLPPFCRNLFQHQILHYLAPFSTQTQDNHQLHFSSHNQELYIYDHIFHEVALPSSSRLDASHQRCSASQPEHYPEGLVAPSRDPLQLVIPLLWTPQALFSTNFIALLDFSTHFAFQGIGFVEVGASVVTVGTGAHRDFEPAFTLTGRGQDWMVVPGTPFGERHVAWDCLAPTWQLLGIITARYDETEGVASDSHPSLHSVLLASTSLHFPHNLKHSLCISSTKKNHRLSRLISIACQVSVFYLNSWTSRLLSSLAFNDLKLTIFG